MPNLLKRSPEKDQEILEALRTKPTYRYAARRARISLTTLQDWRKADPDFAAKCLEARRDGMAAVEDQLVDDALTHNTTAQIFLLKSHMRETYGDHIDHTHHGMITFAADWMPIRAMIFAALANHPDALADVSERLDALEANTSAPGDAE